MTAEKILNIIKKCSTYDMDGGVKYVDKMDYSKLANMLEEAINYNQCCKGEAELLKAIERERFTINTLQRDALSAYCIFCNSLNEVPKTEVTTLIMGCTESKILEKTIEIFKNKTGKPKTE